MGNQSAIKIHYSGSDTSTKRDGTALIVRWHGVITAIPILLCNAVAITGQFEFARQHLPTWHLPGQILYAAALETIAIYLAYSGHAAQLANDSSLRLRVASYSYGLMIGAMNFSHYATFSKPNMEGLSVGLMSASSPFLWAIYTHRISRARLAANGQIDPHAVRLGTTRWTWHPIRSAVTFWLATWKGTDTPAAAIADYELWSKERQSRRNPAQFENVNHDGHASKEIILVDR